MNGRRSSMPMVRLPRMRNGAWPRVTTRSRNGSLTGAPWSRWPWWAARDGPHHDVVVAEGGAAQHAEQPLDQGRVAAVVGVEGEQGLRAVPGPEVGDDVAAAEGVDRLLGVADQHQRHAAGEGALDDLPLDRVGVLELVDHDDRPAPAHPVAGRRVLGLEGDGEPGQQVVEAEDPQQPLAPLELAQHVVGERAAHAGRGARPAGRRAASVVRGLPTTSCASPSACARVSSGLSFASPNRWR